MRNVLLPLLPLALLLAPDARAQTLTTRGVFDDHMVLQQEARVPLEGTAAAGAQVTVTPSWPGAAPLETTAAEDGRWRANLETPAAGGPYSIVVRSGDEALELDDVLIGEVWLCSGQSNMEWAVRKAGDPERELAAAAERSRVRLLTVPNVAALAPADDVAADWCVAAPETVREFSAVGWAFGRELHDRLDVPIGLIASDWGGTPAEAWTSLEGLAAVPGFADAVERLRALRSDPSAQESAQVNAHTPAALFHGMIAPLAGVAIRGVIWYQGESNRERAAQYRSLFPALIRDWRRHFDAELPFYFVQIAPFAYRDDRGEAAELREAQLLTFESVPRTGMVVTMDIGDPGDIHPADKREVGRRLSLWALSDTYGLEGVVCRGPLFREMTVEGDVARLGFDHAGDGLRADPGGPRCFTIAGEDRVFHPAEAVIEGATVLVRSPAVARPVAVRYAWGAADEPDLRNASGLPAPSFRTDDWPMVTAGAGGAR